MKTIKEIQQDQQYSSMLAAAVEKFEKADPALMAEKAGALWHPETKTITVESLGETLSVSWPDGIMKPEREMWHHLVALHYLYQADGTPLTGDTVSFKDLTDGMVRGHGFDFSSQSDLQRMFLGKSEEQIRKCLTDAGGQEIRTKADFGVRFHMFPQYPLYINVWFADDEFPAQGKMLVDASAPHYLMLEDSVTAGEILLNRISEKMTGQPRFRK
ncbi:MAG: DUF3786 domain-containing protein [Eubacterium sp.]|nr:DUF3786 domain-containing protein [Eubacterium sp.]